MPFVFAKAKAKATAEALAAGSPLLGLLGEAREVFRVEVLATLSPTDRALFARAGRACRSAVVASGLTRAGESSQTPFELKHFLEQGTPISAKLGGAYTS